MSGWFLDSAAVRRRRPGAVLGADLFIRLQEPENLRQELLCVGLFPWVHCNHDFWEARSFRIRYVTEIVVVRVKENFEISLLEEMDEYSQRLSRNRRAHAESSQRFTILRCYCHLIDQINMFSQTLGKDGKFQLFICLAARWVSNREILRNLPYRGISVA